MMSCIQKVESNNRDRYFPVLLLMVGTLFIVSLADAEPIEAGALQETGHAVTTPSGLSYIDLAVGDGRKAEIGDTATVHYTGWLTDGTKFDSSVDRGEPFSFRVEIGRAHV